MEETRRERDIPAAPERYPAEVREELQQHDQTHEGAPQPAEGAERGTAQHRGALETAVTPVQPPMEGPPDLIGQRAQDDDLDPADELTPG